MLPSGATNAFGVNVIPVPVKSQEPIKKSLLEFSRLTPVGSKSQETAPEYVTPSIFAITVACVLGCATNENEFDPIDSNVRTPPAPTERETKNSETTDV